MLPLLFIMVFLAAGVTANKAAGKYQVLFFYHLYTLEVAAHGLKNSRMAPECAKSGIVCNMKEFMKEICRIPTKSLPPNFDKVNCGLVGEGEDHVFSTEIDKSGFKGALYNEKLFNDWDQEENFENVMSEAEDIGMKAISKVGANKPIDRVNMMLAALKTHADARRYDQAERFAAKFRDEMKKKGITVAYTDPIERPPVPGYRKIETDKTIIDTQATVGFDKVQQAVMNFVSRKIPR